MNIFALAIFTQVASCTWNDGTPTFSQEKSVERHEDVFTMPDDGTSLTSFEDIFGQEPLSWPSIDYDSFNYLPITMPTTETDVNGYKYYYNDVPQRQMVDVDVVEAPVPQESSTTAHENSEVLTQQAAVEEGIVVETEQTFSVNTQAGTVSTTMEQATSKTSNQDSTMDQGEPATKSNTRLGHSIARQPASLLAKTLNTISNKMDKEKIGINSTGAKVLAATLERFEEILEKLDQLEDSGFSVQVGDVTIDKVSVQAALQRIRTDRPSLRGFRTDSQELLTAMNGRRFQDFAPVVCYEKVTELLVRHAMILYGDIPGVKFDEDGKFSFRGKYFPDPEASRVYYAQKYEKDKKRRLEKSAEQPPDKKQKVSERKCVMDSSRHRFNLKLLVKMHNYIADHLKTAPIDKEQTVTSFAPHLADSIVGLIEKALARKEGLISAEIHTQYPVTMKLLTYVKRQLTERRMPQQKQAIWFLTAFKAPNISLMNGVDMMCTLGHWYAAVAMATIKSIDTICFENGQALVDGKPFLLHREDQN